MKKLMLVLTFLCGTLFADTNLLKNPVFAGTLGKNNRIDGWLLKNEFCRIKDGVLSIDIPAGLKVQIVSDVVTLNQEEAAPVKFGMDYRGRCEASNWEHCLVLSDFTYMDGTAEKWSGPIIIPIPLDAAEWQSLQKTVKMAKPIKSFRFLVVLRDKTSVEIRKPFVTEVKKKGRTVSL